jgi:hypothetical protein
MTPGWEPPKDESDLRAHGSNQRSPRSPRHAVARALTHQASPASIRALGILTPHRWPARRPGTLSGKPLTVGGSAEPPCRVCVGVVRCQLSQPVSAAIQWLWSFIRLCVAATSRHSDNAAVRPRRWKRLILRFELDLREYRLDRRFSVLVDRVPMFAGEHSAHERIHPFVPARPDVFPQPSVRWDQHLDPVADDALDLFLVPVARVG